jgi:hypothetical protein
LLLDAAFPRGSEERGHSGVVLVRWERGDETDTGLIRFAKANSFDGIVFMGDDVLARSEVLEAARAAQITLVVVSSDYPNKAISNLENHLSDIKSRGRGSQVLIVASHEVRRLPTVRKG